MPMKTLIVLVCALLAGGLCQAGLDPFVVSRGKIDGAAYIIVSPTNWNGRLLLYQHGLSDSSLPPAVDINVESEPYQSLVAEGWMVAASSYRRSGLIVKDALTDVRNLYQHIGATFGTPKRTLLMGGSMGGAITIRLIEADPATFAGAIVLGTALEARDGVLAELTYGAKVPVIFMTNQSEIHESATYVKKTATNAVPAALWIIERNGHVKFTGPEYVEVVRALNRWVEGGQIVRERKFAIPVKEPPTTARFADQGAYGKVRQVGGGFGNLSASFVEADFKQLGIALGDKFQMGCGGKTYTATYADTFTDVPSGQWVGFKDADGYYVISIVFGNASRTAGLKPGDEIFIRKN